MLSKEIFSTYQAILIEELQPAMGCTEPIAIAYASALMRDALGEIPTDVEIALSGNIIKNVKSVIVPATGGMHGIEAAVAAGIISGRFDLKLELLSVLGEDDRISLRSYLKRTPIRVSELKSNCTFDLLVTGRCGENTARVQISGYHTNIVRAECNGKSVIDRYVQKEVLAASTKNAANRSLLTVESIIEFADSVDLDELRPYLLRQIKMNMDIAEEGLRNPYGASIGQLLLKDGNVSIKDKARAYAAAG
jgi:L-cysteine desulfidase